MTHAGSSRGSLSFTQGLLLAAGLATSLLGTAVFTQSQTSNQAANSQQSAQSQPAQPQPTQDIPDAPSTVQPPSAFPAGAAAENPAHMSPPDSAGPSSSQPATPGAQPGAQPGTQPGDEMQPPPKMPPIETVPEGSIPRQTSAGQQQIYKLVVNANFVQVPVMVKDSDGRRVDGLLPKDFSVYENGKKQAMTFFTSDPFELSVAVLIDIGMPDVAVQKINQTFPALVGAFSPYDEVALYTYSSTVSQVSDYSGLSPKLTAVLNEMKLERGRNNGVPVLNGPLAPNGPIVNGIPVGSPTTPVSTPPREAHVLNDAILRAALDLSKRDRTRRKVIFVISDGRELGSNASYSDVLKVLETQGIQVKAVALDSAAIPGYNKLAKLHLPGQGYTNLLPKYAYATGGGKIYTEFSRNAIESAYADITSEARNQYTIGYATRATASSTYRNIEIRVGRPGLKIYAKDGYYPAPPAR